MFRQIVRSTALTSDAANSYFEHIRGYDFREDVTFLSTLRALVAPRMPADESLDLIFNSNHINEATAKSYPSATVVKSLCNSFNSSNRGVVYVHNMDSNSPEDNTYCLDLLKTSFTKIYKGWHRLTKVSDLFRNQFYTLCFINPELKSVAIFVDSLSISKLHYLQCAILGFFPWYFVPEQGVSAEEMALINTLRAKDVNDYIACIAKLAEKYDFRAAKIKQQLAGFETVYERQRCDSIRRDISNVDDNIERYNAAIGEQLANRRDLEIQLLGLETKIASGSESSEIMDYFLHNKRLDLDYVDSSDLAFIAKDYITYFDEDAAKSVIDNPNSVIYMPDGRACNNYIPAKKVKELMYAIFIDQSIRIKVCAAYRFSLTGNVQAVSEYHFGAEYAEYMPNPHIQGFSCMGNYITAINKALHKRDYISALEQTIASAKSLNFTDSTVIRYFMRNVYGLSYDESTRAKHKWFELPDGTCVTAAEAADWVWAQRQQGEQEENTNE